MTDDIHQCNWLQYNNAEVQFICQSDPRFKQAILIENGGVPLYDWVFYCPGCGESFLEYTGTSQSRPRLQDLIDKARLNEAIKDFTVDSKISKKSLPVESKRNSWEWELDVSLDEGKTWNTVHGGPSVDSCKTYAREHYHKGSYGCINTEVWYRIYGCIGQEQLYQVSANNKSWRMKWTWGNLRPRDQQYSPGLS